MLIAQLTGSQMVLSYLKCPWGKTITSFSYPSKSKRYLARESGLHFSCNSGRRSREVQQSPTCAAPPTSFSLNLSVDLISPTSLEWETLGEGDTTCLDKVSAGVSGHLQHLRVPPAAGRRGSFAPTQLKVPLDAARARLRAAFPRQGALQVQGTTELKLFWNQNSKEEWTLRLMNKF